MARTTTRRTRRRHATWILALTALATAATCAVSAVGYLNVHVGRYNLAVGSVGDGKFNFGLHELQSQTPPNPFIPIVEFVRPQLLPRHERLSTGWRDQLPFWLLVTPYLAVYLYRTGNAPMDVPAGHCGHCGYDTTTIAAHTCPECGAPIMQYEARASGGPRISLATRSRPGAGPALSHSSLRRVPAPRRGHRCRMLKVVGGLERG